MRQVKAADGRLHLHLGVVGPPQDLDDASLGRSSADRVGGQIRHHLLPVLGLAAPFGGDGDHQVEPGLFGDDDSAATGLFIASDYAAAGPLADGRDAPFHFAATHSALFGPHFDRVAVHGALHLALGDEDVLAAPLGGDEAVAVAVGRKGAADAFPRRRQSVAAAPEADDLAVIGHVLQYPFQFGFDVSAAELPQQSGEMDRSVLIFENSKYIFLGELHGSFLWSFCVVSAQRG